jgi:4-hydroxybenzoate polyprenyltransferase
VETAGAGILALAGLCLYCLHLARQLRRVEGATPQVALALFRSNFNAGLILFAGIALQGWLARFLF